ncbi:MAG TPA: ribose 5-phosphate isomerase A [Euryarchaeota archaeon]|nr:ribose 5-phosphate isomerase A [Euryarchaeota archaeon]
MTGKFAAASEAARRVKDGQVIGLGSGTTAELAIEEIGRRMRDESIEIIGIPTSIMSEKTALQAGIEISSLDEHGELDLTIDGADEIDPALNLIKGLGGALLREKIVAEASRVELIIADRTKLVERLGTKAPLPVEITRFAPGHFAARLSKLGCTPILRSDGGKPFVTDNGNYVIDCKFAEIKNPSDLEFKIKSIAGVVETGLFIGIADEAIIGMEDGSTRSMSKSE